MPKMIQDDPDTEALAEEVMRWTRHLDGGQNLSLVILSVLVKTLVKAIQLF